jgi:hypothetical protein
VEQGSEFSVNTLYSSLRMRRRYEAWFITLRMADGSGAWWFRYLLHTPGRSRNSAARDPQDYPVQIWATWFPRDASPQSFFQGFPLKEFSCSSRTRDPFRLQVGDHFLDDHGCRSRVDSCGHRIRWEVQCRSTQHYSVSEVGWIGFYRAAHGDALFSGFIEMDGRRWEGDILGWGVQGHNCGYRHRRHWSWAHCLWLDEKRPVGTLEALSYEIPLGLRVRRAVLWQEGVRTVFHDVREKVRSREPFVWELLARDPNSSLRVQVHWEGHPPSTHVLSYRATDGRSSFEVCNNCLARATVRVHGPDLSIREWEADGGAILEMAGD